MNTVNEDPYEIGLTEAARFLGVSEHSLERWIRQGTIPCIESAGEIAFDKSLLREWAQSNKMAWFESPRKPVSEAKTISLANAIRSGGVYSDIAGTNAREVLEAAVRAVALPDGIDRNLLLSKLLERENLASTGLGGGVAVPHPRTPLKNAPPDPIAAACFLSSPIDYGAIDGEPVFVLFLMISPNTKAHLQLLARVGFCLRDKSFTAFLREKPDGEALRRRVEELEAKMEVMKGR
ncbi:MAG: PTS sugar transporter subunit IIA [Candidatus Omnitrophota bacterium]